MRKFTFLKQWLLVVFMLLGSVSMVHADDELITTQIPVNVTTAGTLSTKISSNKKYLITNLKLTGKLNVDDIKFIRDMAGDNGHLYHLDMSGVEFVGGGSFYVRSDHKRGYAYFSSNSVGTLIFAGLKNLQSIKLPSYLTSIEISAFDCCYSLSSITFPKELVTIESGAFYGCN